MRLDSDGTYLILQRNVDTQIRVTRTRSLLPVHIALWKRVEGTWKAVSAVHLQESECAFMGQGVRSARIRQKERKCLPAYAVPDAPDTEEYEC